MAMETWSRQRVTPTNISHTRKNTTEGTAKTTAYEVGEERATASTAIDEA